VQATRLLKSNIDALLRARRQTRHDLAMWCRRSDPWLSKILSESPTDQARGVPLKYLDRIADFFGLAAYQLLQPGLTGLLERRKAERRSGRDRRLSALNQKVRQSLSEAVASLSPADIADMIRLKTLSVESRDVLREAMQAAERSEQQAVRRGRTPRAAGTAATAASTRSGSETTGDQKPTEEQREGPSRAAANQTFRNSRRGLKG
jgi:hypothetical protein